MWLLIQNIIWQVRCALALILHEFGWRLRIRFLSQLGKRKRLGTVLGQLYKEGIAVIPNYYSDEELVLIDQYCSKALKESEDKPADEILIARRGGSVRLKQLQKKYPLLRRFSEDIFIVFINIVFSLRIRFPNLIYSVTDTKAYQSVTEQEAKYLFGINYHFDNYFHQLKAIVVLEDVRPENGPTSFIPNSSGIHWNQFNYFLFKYKGNKVKVKSCNTYKTIQEGLEKRVYDDSEFLENDFCESLIAKKTPQLITANRGSLVLFDTRNIHRATPPESGCRRLLWMYF